MIFPITFKYNTGENLVIKKREEDAKEKQIKLLFEAIRKHNNKYVQFYLATEKNIATRKMLTDKYINRSAGVYGVRVRMDIRRLLLLLKQKIMKS